jgi:threonine aldolase
MQSKAIRLDFRSDTVTRPGPQMRATMAAADVGDDVLGDDFTVKALETRLAAMFGKEAGLLLPTGTMANLAAIMCHCQRGEEFLRGTEAHTYLWEAKALRDRGIAASFWPGGRMRWVTHLDVDRGAVDEAIGAVREFAEARQQKPAAGFPRRITDRFPGGADAAALPRKRPPIRLRPLLRFRTAG